MIQSLRVVYRVALSQTALFTALSVLALAGCVSCPLSEEAWPVTVRSTYAFDPGRCMVSLSTDGQSIPLLRAPGPIWPAGETEGFAAAEGALLVSAASHDGRMAYTYANAAGDVSWQVSPTRGQYGECVLELGSESPGVLAAHPGLLQVDAAWIALDLNQNSLAHGQAHWPKTYYLPERQLFVCVWWDWSVANASSLSWPGNRSDPRRGVGPCEPAARMLYQSGPDGERATLHEALHIRAGRRLWDVALPSLCRPSEFRDDMAEMVYLDFWGGKSARHVEHALRCLEELTAPHIRYLTILQKWQAGGFDALLPDSIWMPDYPPTPAFGSEADLRRVSVVGNRLGRFGFRTNYAFLRPESPSHRRGLVDHALGPDGKPKWYTQPSRWRALASRQENEIKALWPTSALFIDQLASGGSPQAYVDFGPEGDGTMATALKHQRDLARLVKQIHKGPLGSETLNQQDLIGYYCDFGDYSVMNGHNRLFPVDYKLRRLHDVTVSYGCGLDYRFLELPPFKTYHAGKTRLWDDPLKMDDYRCCEIMLGNAAYLRWEAPWDWTLTECVQVGRLQRHYVNSDVVSIDYQHQGQWRSLEQLVVDGFVPEVRPWNQKQDTLGRVRVCYSSGLTIWVNRLVDPLTVETGAGQLVLPRSGWAAATADGSVLAYSAYWPGTEQRVDYLREAASGLVYLNPRGSDVDGVSGPALWHDGRLLWEVDVALQTARMGGRDIALTLPEPEPLTSLDFDFSSSLSGMRPVAGILRVEAVAEGQALAVVTHDPQLYTPPLAIDGRAGDEIELIMSASDGVGGQLYFETPEDRISERQVVRFKVVPDGRRHLIRIPVGAHPRWAGARITMIRLDPVHGPSSCSITVHALRLRRL